MSIYVDQDALRLIFRHVEGTWNLARFSRVCREWRTAAEPVLFSNITVYGTRSLKKLARTINDAWRKDQAQDPAIYINRLTIAMLEDRVPASLPAEAIAFLTRTTNLRELFVSETVSLAAITAIRQSSSESLKDLTFTLEDSASYDSLALLSSFPNLRELEIMLLPTTGPNPPRIPSKSAWLLPHLNLLTVEVQNDTPYVATSIVQLMCRSRMPSLRTLKFFSFFDNEAAARHLGDFCSQRELQLAYIHIEPEHSSLVITRIRAHNIRLTRITPSLAIQLPSALRRLDIDEGSTFDMLWAAFDALLAQETEMKDIHLHLPQPYDRWVHHTPVTAAEHVGARELSRLLRYASLFSFKGISLRDADSKTVGDYFQNI